MRRPGLSLSILFALLASCRAFKKETPAPAANQLVAETDVDAAEAPEGRGAYRTAKDRQGFIDMGNGSWWCVTALEKGKSISWCGWGPKSVAESQARDWGSTGIPGDTTNVKIVEAKRIYFIEVFDGSSFKSSSSLSSWALDLPQARKAAKEAQDSGLRVKWHLVTRSEYFDDCFDLPACL